MSRRLPLELVVQSLDLSVDRKRALGEIPESAWTRLLRLTDEARLTLPLAIRCADFLPAETAARVRSNLRSNYVRRERVIADWREIAGSLGENGIEFIVLKGLSHWPFYAEDPAHRPQYDFDVYCPPDSIHQAQAAIIALGYEPLRDQDGLKTDHLPALIRRTGFKWRGDYFDPALPLS